MTCRSSMTVLVMVSALALVAPSYAGDPVPILPSGMRWHRPPDNADVRGAWIVGSESRRGPYLFRVILAAGGRIPPHRHPDERSTTVLSGTLYVGFGHTVDEAKLVAVPAGAVYVVPANVAHYVVAKDGEVTYQEAGVAPTATIPAR